VYPGLASWAKFSRPFGTGPKVSSGLLSYPQQSLGRSFFLEDVDRENKTLSPFSNCEHPESSETVLDLAAVI
jgi:hypothetical protein